jgi:hypothetical protein
MPLPALNWRFVGDLAFTPGSINAGLDGLYTLGTATTYADGTARTPGTGSAWTWNREVSGVTVAAYGNPPTNALNFRYIVGGTVGAVAYPILTPDAVTQVNTLVYGMNRSSGAFTSWGNAQPFTSGFSSYWRATRAFSAVTYDTVALWESQEGCVIQYGVISTGAASSVQFGALFDPLSSAGANSESDGRLYAMCGSGSSTTTANNWLSSGNAMFGEGSVTANDYHAGIFAPGTTVMFGGAGVQTKRFGNFTVTTEYFSGSGDVPRVPLCVTSTAGAFLGQGRGIYITRDTMSRTTLMNGAAPVGYIVSASLIAPQDAVLLGA